MNLLENPVELEVCSWNENVREFLTKNTILSTAKNIYKVFGVIWFHLYRLCQILHNGRICPLIVRGPESEKFLQNFAIDGNTWFFVDILLRKYAVISTCDFSVFLVYFCGVVVLKRFSEYPGTLWAESIPHLERPVIRLSPQISLQQRSKTPLMSLSRNSHPNLSHIRNIPVGLTLKTDITVILISHSLYLHPFKLAYDMPHIP